MDKFEIRHPEHSYISGILVQLLKLSAYVFFVTEGIGKYQDIQYQ